MTDYKLDSRSEEEILAQLNELAGSYTPKWRLDTKNPDAGSVIAMLFAKQMAENITRLNQGLEQFHTEFVNLLGISPLPARPAAALVKFAMDYDTIAGTMVPKGTKLYQNQDSQMIVFETEHPLYVTSARLRNLFMVSNRTGQIQPLLGTYQPTAIVPGLEEAPCERKELKPFTLFEFSGAGIERNALVLYHETILDGVGEEITLTFGEAKRWIAACQEGRIQIMYPSKDGLLPVESAAVEGNLLQVKFQQKNKAKALVFLTKEVTEQMELKTIKLSSRGTEQEIAFVSDGSSNLDGKKFAPFGEMFHLYDEVYFGHDAYFSKSGATLTIRFHLNIRQHREQIHTPDESGDLKIIKRKKKSLWNQTAAESYVQEISLEYYNGKGWRRLAVESPAQNAGKIFAGKMESPPHIRSAENNEGEVEFHIKCPADWAAQNAFGYEGRLLRMQIRKADNCYYYPCCHNYPEISRMRVSYSYEDAEYPTKVETVYGTHKEDLTESVRLGREICAFVRGTFLNDAESPPHIRSAENSESLYLGFDKKPERGPISILFEIDENNSKKTDTEFQLEYAALNGFAPLRIVDRTDSFQKTGCIRFLPPEQMKKQTLLGKSRYWLRLVKEESPPHMRSAENADRKTPGGYPVINRILLNVAEAVNINTLEEEVFYLDEVTAGMEFSLHMAEHILDAEVWVNEVDSLTLPQMKQMLTEFPEDTKAEVNLRGEIQDFYVRWEEADDFETSGPKDRHFCLDRMNHKIIFGDGVHVRIPQIVKSAAFRVRVRCCDGIDGNIKAESIEGSLKSLHFIDDVTNLYPACGGIHMESTGKALKRGAAILSGRRRLTTQADFVRECLSFSESVDKVSCVCKDNRINLILLMKEIGRNTRPFEELLPSLREHLCKRCELTIKPEMLQMMEPIFVELSVTVWIRLRRVPLKADSGFEITERIKRELDQYFHPVSSADGSGKSPSHAFGGKYGWEIGRLPRLSQIQMKLNSFDANMVVRKLIVYAVYRDEQGRHECELEELKENPYFVCKSGIHQIHVSGKSPSHAFGGK